MARRRVNFAIARRFVDPSSWVFLDESWVNEAMTTTYGRPAVGQRCVDAAPHGHWKTTTLISAIRLDGVIESATQLIDGTMNGVTFRGWTELCLAPSLRPGDVVVMDNLAAHKAGGVAEAIESAGASVWYLPPYSPDLNPIEKLWSKVKAGLRRLAARSFDTLVSAAAETFRDVADDECSNYFKSCGYGDYLRETL